MSAYQHAPDTRSNSQLRGQVKAPAYRPTALPSIENKGGNNSYSYNK
jgi:hypothetical protein